MARSLIGMPFVSAHDWSRILSGTLCAALLDVNELGFYNKVWCSSSCQCLKLVPSAITEMSGSVLAFWRQRSNRSYRYIEDIEDISSDDGNPAGDEKLTADHL